MFKSAEIENLLELVESMGFTAQMGKKAILSVGVADPNAVIEALLSGRFNEDDEAEDDVE